MFKILIVGACTFFALCAGSFIEDTSYAVIKKVMIAEGVSEMRADCFVKVLKYTGVTSDVTDIRNIINPGEIMKNLSNKSQIADFACSPFGVIVAFVILLVFSFLCCIFLKRCCCKSTPQRTLMVPSSLQINNVKMPYRRMDNF